MSLTNTRAMVCTAGRLAGVLRLSVQKRHTSKQHTQLLLSMSARCREKRAVSTSQSAPELSVSGPVGLADGFAAAPAGVAMYGGAPAAALPEDVVKPPELDEGVATLAELVVTGAGAGPEGPTALGMGGNPHFMFSCSMFDSQYELPALPRHAAGSTQNSQMCFGVARHGDLVLHTRDQPC